MHYKGTFYLKHISNLFVITVCTIHDNTHHVFYHENIKLFELLLFDYYLKFLFTPIMQEKSQSRERVIKFSGTVCQNTKSCAVSQTVFTGKRMKLRRRRNMLILSILTVNMSYVVMYITFNLKVLIRIKTAEFFKTFHKQLTLA